MPTGIHGNHKGGRKANPCFCKLWKKCSVCISRQNYLRRKEKGVKKIYKNRYVKKEVRLARINIISDKELERNMNRYFEEKRWQ